MQGDARHRLARRLAVAAVLAAAALVVPVPVAARAAVRPVLDTSTRPSMRAAYNNVLKPALAVPIGWTGSVDPCVAGAPSAAAQQATLDAVNFFRDMAGVAPATFDAGLSSEAQAAALIMQAQNDLSHDPPPDWKCWTQPGHDGAAHSNIALGAAGAGAIALYMDDPGGGNAAAGHRRWVLAPNKTVLGSGSTGSAHALYVLGASTTGGPEPEWAGWPIAGYHPLQIEPDGRWSLSSADGTTDFSAATVTVQRGATSLPVTLYPVADGYGSNTLVWQVDPGYTTGRRDQRYDVTVSNIMRNGTPLSHAYSVTLFDANIDPAQTIAFAQPADRVYGATATLTATTNASLPVTFTSTTPSVCTTTGTRGTTLTAVGVGTCTVDADQAGDVSHDPAPTVTRSLQVGQRTLTVRADDAARAVGADNPPLTYTVTGFASGETLGSSDVTGTPDCTTTATTGSPPGAYPVTCAAGTLASGHYAFAFADGTLMVGSGYFPLLPARLLDTRPGKATVDGLAAGGGAVGPGAVRDLVVTGRGGVPSTGVGAVVLNVTAVAPTSTSVVTVWPAGAARPNASSLNPVRGVTTPNLVVAQVGAGGSVSIHNGAGSVHVVADVVGWFPAGGSYTPLLPARLLDTRPGRATVDGVASGGGALGPGATANLTVTGRGGVPASGVGAVILNVTAVAPSTNTVDTVWPAGWARPNASSLNPAHGVTRPNLVIVQVGAGGQVSLHNAAGSVHLVADVVGWFPAGADYTPLLPSRLLDTRPGRSTVDGLAAGDGAVGSGQTRDLVVTGRGGVPATGVSAVVLNVTAVAPTATSFVTVWPAGSARPNASNLNPVKNVTAPNLVIVRVGAGGQVTLYSSAGSTHFVADVVGWFATP
jgi:uncharacterized protein YkwD